MIKVNSYTLDNGLKLLHHKDATTKMVALNLLYKVGARNEQPEKTGFAHLFEHLMFSGSVNSESFDEPLQVAGGESNAWTSNDVTNYYDIVPVHNVETAFWLESDRLLNLSLTEKKFEAQKSVVIEEFKQRCLNTPYGDVSHIIRGAAYTVHPYRWPVIGLSTDVIAEATLDDAWDFFNSHYSVDNLIMCVSGNIEFERAVKLTEKWFGDIEPRNMKKQVIPVEPIQESPRTIRVERDVPKNMILKAYHMCGRNHIDYQTSDIISDILANGNSSRFFRNVLMKNDVFSSLDASIGGSVDPGLFYVRGYLNEGVSYEQGEEIIKKELEAFLQEGASEYEITRYVNKLDSKEQFENISYLEKATKLCSYEFTSQADDINVEMDKYRAITSDDIKRVAQKILNESNCTTLFYGK